MMAALRHRRDRPACRCRALASSAWLSRLPTLVRRPSTAEVTMTTTAQFRLVAPPEVRAPIVPNTQVINLTIENDEKLLLSVAEAAREPTREPGCRPDPA